MGLNSSRHGGFTLIEVLVALAIFAVLAAALVLASGNFAERQRRIEERTLALWAAQNALDELRVGFPGAASGPDIDGQATVSSAAATGWSRGGCCRLRRPDCTASRSR